MPCAAAVPPPCRRLLWPGTWRGLSSSRAVASGHVPPESPLYIRLPPPPQSEEPKVGRVRGHLPVPREIFPRPEGDRKLRPEYMQRAAPEPAVQRQPSNQVQEWKAEMAQSRRTNFEQGLRALWARRSRRQSIRRVKASRNFEANKKAGATPEREDDRLTRSTILDALFDTKLHPDPDRFSRAERSRTRVLAKEKAKREARRDALMELYINTANFIVHEGELKAEIETIFAPDYFRKQSQSANRYGATDNIWGIYGKPTSISSMLENATGTSTKIIDFDESEYDRSVKRQKKIAEDLTGGKME